ncbi:MULTISPECIES: hypothetical protein [unclassified Pseudomonas]|uniref:hypothetical protein n=1 Tax=unclassified Pseudomonas TaxID=196821 RepID=UPI00235F4B57|nr:MULTISPECIES: hypothetical protein [unclassified Pseudomonas]
MGLTMGRSYPTRQPAAEPEKAKSRLMIRIEDTQPGELSLAGAAVYDQSGLMLPAARS